MVFRFDVQKLELPNNQSILSCDTVPTFSFDDVTLELQLNGSIVATSTDLSSGITGSFPATVGTLTATVSIETANVVKVDVLGLELWESADIKITLGHTDFFAYSNTFKIFGYDIGNNPAVNNGDGAPINYNPNVSIVLVPLIAGLTAAMADVSGLGTDAIIADTYGSVGNGIIITGDGILDLGVLVNIYNIANPTNTVMINNLYDPAFIPGLGVVYTLSGGIDESYLYPYASVTGWSAPFTNIHYAYDLSSSTGETIYLNSDTTQFGMGKSATRCCNEDGIVNVEKSSYTITACNTRVLVGTCTDTITIVNYNLIPRYFGGLTCPDCCATDGCVIALTTYDVDFSINSSELSIMYVNDVSQIGTSEVEVAYEMYNGKGVVYDGNTTTFDYALENYPTWTTTLPAYGSYILLLKVYIDGVFECTTPYKYEGCHYYHIDQLECGKYRVYNYSSVEVNTSIKKLNDDKVLEEVQTGVIPACEYQDYEFTVDGVYSIYVNGTVPEQLIMVVDCNIRACFVNYLQKLACSSKSACSCGGKCASGCSAIPTDFYNFNAFMSLSYGYYSLLNNEYLENYIYAAIVGDETDFGQEDLERLHNINVFIQRATEYCEECESPRDVTGCITCK